MSTPHSPQVLGWGHPLRAHKSTALCGPFASQAGLALGLAQGWHWAKAGSPAGPSVDDAASCYAAVGHDHTPLYQTYKGGRWHQNHLHYSPSSSEEPSKTQSVTPGLLYPLLCISSSLGLSRTTWLGAENCQPFRPDKKHIYGRRCQPKGVETQLQN